MIIVCDYVHSWVVILNDGDRVRLQSELLKFSIRHEFFHELVNEFGFKKNCDDLKNMNGIEGFVVSRVQLYFVGTQVFITLTKETLLFSS